MRRHSERQLCSMTEHTETDVPCDERCVHNSFEENKSSVRQRPFAVVFDDRSDYAELNRQANRLAPLSQGARRFD